jgi:hypothetical protein
MTLLSRLWQNRNCDSCEKYPTGTKKTGIRRIPAGITYLDRHNEVSVSHESHSGMGIVGRSRVAIRLLYYLRNYDITPPQSTVN